MALPPAGKPHRIPIGFLFSHLNRITNDTRSGNSNNWCLSVVWLTSSDADQLHTRKQHRRLSFLALNYKRTIIVLKIRIQYKNMENDTDDVKATSINFDYPSLATCIKIISMRYYIVIGQKKNVSKQKKINF